MKIRSALPAEPAPRSYRSAARGSGMARTNVTFVRDILDGVKLVMILLPSEQLLRTRVRWPPCSLTLADVKEDLKKQCLGEST